MIKWTATLQTTRSLLLIAALFGFSYGEVNAGCTFPTTGSVCPETWRTAHLIGADQELNQFAAVSMVSTDGVKPATAITAISLRQTLGLKVTAALLEVNYTAARINGEIDDLNDLKGSIEEKDEHRTKLIDLGTLFMAVGSGAVGPGLDLKSGTSQAGNIVSVASGSIAAGLSIAAGQIKENASGSLKTVIPSMLSQILGRSPQPNDRYPNAVWKFLTTEGPPKRPGISWRQDLLNQWNSSGLSTPGENLDLLTTSGPQNLQAGINDINRRSSMLADLRAAVEQFLPRLAELTRYIAQPAIVHVAG